jgi:hypothetical protein
VSLRFFEKKPQRLFYAKVERIIRKEKGIPEPALRFSAKYLAFSAVKKATTR